MSVQEPSAQQQVMVQASNGARARKPKENLVARQMVRGANNGVVMGIAILIGALWSIPTLGLFISSFRPPSEIATTGWWQGLVPPWHFTLENYQQVLLQQGMGNSFLNSLILAIPGTVFPILVAAFAAYAFAWMKFPGRDWFFLGIVALMVIPLQIALAPILQMFTAIGLTGQYAAVWLAHTGFGLPFSIYLLRNFFASLPTDLMESAHIDGAGHWLIFWRIILPLAVPALASLAIFQFMWVWNDLLVALIFLGGSPERAPMTVTVANLVNSFGSNYQVMTAAAFISMALPLIVFFALQRYFVRGILAGSVKG